MVVDERLGLHVTNVLGIEVEKDLKVPLLSEND
jgi:hypothetical protein